MIILLLLMLVLLGVFPLGFFLFRSLNQGAGSTVETLDGEMALGSEKWKTQEWWESQRGKFNWSLIFAGIAAFILNAFLLPLIVAEIPQFGPGGGFFSVLLQILAYLIYIGVANVFYSLGPLIANIRKKKKKAQFRQNGFQLIRAVFVLAPQLIVLFLFF